MVDSILTVYVVPVFHSQSDREDPLSIRRTITVDLLLHKWFCTHISLPFHSPFRLLLVLLSVAFTCLHLLAKVGLGHVCPHRHTYTNTYT